METVPAKQIVRQETKMTMMERFDYRFLVKKVLDNLLLGSLQLLDKSLGAVYFVLDFGFEGLEASKVKDIVLPHNFSSSTSSSHFSSSSSLSPASSTSTSSSSTPRSSNDFNVEDSILMPGFNSRIDHHDPDVLSILSSPTPSGHQHGISRPRRAGIIAERKNAKNYGEGISCTCWGWEVEEEAVDDAQFPIRDTLQELPLEDDDGDDNEYGNVGSSVCRDSNDVTVRWSECQCADCRKLWMPMSRARSRLHVQKWNSSNDDSDVELNRNMRKWNSSNDDSDVKLNRNTRKSACEFVGGTLKGQPVREPEFGGRNVRSSATSTPTTVEGVAGRRDGDWISNLMIGAKSLRKTCVDSDSISGVEKREVETTGVIFLHGIFSSSDFWFDSNIVPMLDGGIKTRHVILAPDLLGCGRSPRPHDSVYTLSDQVDALENSLVRKHSLESFHIVAHSMGTVPALALAARFPHRVRSLTLIAPVYAGYTDPEREGSEEEILTDCNSILSFQDPWSMRAIRSLTASEYYNINRCFGHLLFSRHRLLVPILQDLLQNRWPRSFVRDYLAVTHDAAWHIVHNTMIGGSHALVPALRKLRDRGMRVFVIHGTDDTSCPFQQSELMTQHFENVVLAPVLGKGHVDVVLGRDEEVLSLLEEEIRLGDRNFTEFSARRKLS